MHRRGDRIKVRVEGLSHPWLTVFSLSGSGVVHYLYPRPCALFPDPCEEPGTLTTASFELEAEVEWPYGADHVVAVSAASALDGLNAALRRLDRQVAADRTVALLSVAKAGACGWSPGVQGLYTAR